MSDGSIYLWNTEISLWSSYLASMCMKSWGLLQCTTTSIFDYSLYRLSSLGGNSGSTKFLKVFSNSTFSMLSNEDSARGYVLNIFLDLSIIEFRLAWAFAWYRSYLSLGGSNLVQLTYHINLECGNSLTTASVSAHSA